MNNKHLMFQHPIDRLNLYDLEPHKWDCQNPPDLFLFDDSALVPPALYMPPLWLVEISEKDRRIEPLENGQFKFSFKLTQAVNLQWLSFLKRYYDNVDVTADGDMLILSCYPKDLEENYEKICRSAIYKATKDYRQERDTLVWLVFEKMKKQERCEHTQTEIESEMKSYRRQRQERLLVAQQNGWSASFIVQDFNERFRETLENRFVWWAKVLDDATIRRYRAMFEMELVVV